jgi:dTDP-4-amino-4,6-dideoxygalactose transaminase
VEDAAHALPCSYRGQTIGTFGTASVFSFYGTKPLATGEGGMITTTSPRVAKRIKAMRLHGISRETYDRQTSRKPHWHYEVIAPGFKYNLPDLMAAIGIHQLRKVKRFQQRREAIARTYTQELAGLPLAPPAVRDPGDRHAWHLYVIRLRLEALRINRDAFIERLGRQGIGASVHFIPLHLHPYWRDRYGFQPQDFPAALDGYGRAVSLPIYSRMSDTDVERVITAVKKICRENYRRSSVSPAAPLNRAAA